MIKKISTQKISPFLWFSDRAQEAAEYYVSVFGKKFPSTKLTKITYYDEQSSKASGCPEGSVMTVSFLLAGQEFIIMNGGNLPEGWSKISGSVSFVVNCENQEEVDYFWEKLSEGGKKSVCGWIERDKFGVTWQITPVILMEMMADPDPEKAKRVMAAMLKMSKIDIAKLEEAYQG